MQSYICSICQNHLIDPLVLKECKHSFCKICYKSSKSNLMPLFGSFDSQSKQKVRISELFFFIYKVNLCKIFEIKKKG